MNAKELKAILDDHALYLAGKGGKRANLSRANLTGANLYGATLTGADLSGAYLYGATLSRANLYGANLSRANLSRAYLSGADLSGAVGGELAIAQTRILPDEGSVVGWKKCKQGVLVKLLVPEEAKRSHAFGRKCRAEYALVLDVIGAEVGISGWDGTEYQKGMTVRPKAWDDNWQNECAPGIHFFITRKEAEEYNL